MNDKSIDPQSRAIIRYALEINDPWLARLLRRADAGEAIVDIVPTSEKEVAELNRSQIVIGSQKHRDPLSKPYAFTELGVAMLSTVLRSKRDS